MQTHDKYLVKRVTDAANNTLQLTLDGTTALATNTPPLAADRVCFIKARFLVKRLLAINMFMQQHLIL